MNNLLTTEEDRLFWRHLINKENIVSVNVKDFLNLLADFEELLKAQAWQPIETAPRDGTVVLVGFSCPKPYVCISKYLPLDEDQEIGGLWDCEPFTGDEPTHWVPLPQPPQAAGDEVVTEEEVG